MRRKDGKYINYLVIDGEWTVGNWKKGQGGDPFDPDNKLCLVGLKWSGQDPTALKIEYDAEPFGAHLELLQEQINQAELLVLFNAKRDLHWLRRYGIKFHHKRVWDVQLAHFIITGQASPYPSLNEVAAYYELGQKDDVIEKEYWSKQIDVQDIPLNTLVDYNYLDLRLTGEAFEKQQEFLKDKAKMKHAITLGCMDLLILEEMEWNGLIYDVEESKKLAEQIRGEIAQIDGKLVALVGNAPINWNSGDHLSAVLYGGSVSVTFRELDGVYKSGKKVGQPKYKLSEKTYKFERLVQPLPRSELDKDGYFSTAEPILRQLRAYGKAKQIISCLLDRARLEKLVSSYYEGIPKQITANHWEGNRIHGTLNQCVAATGRLSSSKPNLQNNPKAVDKLFRSRYA